MRKIAVLMLLLTLLACEIEVAEKTYHSFEEVSQPYLDKYGPPEETNSYISGSYESINWWWWSQGFMVNFKDSPYDSVWGWVVGHTYTFEPI